MVAHTSSTKFRRQTHDVESRGQPGLLNKFQASLDYKVRLKKQNKPKPYNLEIISFAFLESQETK